MKCTLGIQCRYEDIILNCNSTLVYADFEVRRTIQHRFAL